MKTILFLLSFAVFFPNQAEAQSGFIKVSAGHAVFVDYVAPKGGKPTLVLVNGLVYDFSRWNDLARPLAQAGYGILRYNFRGQSKTFLKELEAGRPKFYSQGISREDYSKELSDVLDALKISKAVVVGLSYGSGIAAEFGLRFPAKVEKLVFLAPLVVPLDRYDTNGAWINMNLDALRLFWGPLWGPYVYDFYYNMIFRSYLDHRLVPERIPAEMQNIPDDYKEAIFHQVRAMRDFDLRSARFQLKGRVHLVLASQEEEPALKDQFASWKSFGPNQGSLVYLSPSWHAIPDAQGALAAEILHGMISNSPAFSGGRAYYSPVKDGVRGLVPMSPRDLETRALSERRE